MIKELLAKSRERKQNIAMLEEQLRVQDTVFERQKSHSERELIKSLREEKEKLMKEALYWDSKKRSFEDRLKARDMMMFNPEFFNDDSILKQKNVFLRGGFNDGW